MEREERALRAIKAVVDAVDHGSITIAMDPTYFDVHRHIYGINVIRGMIRNHAYAGLGLNIPDPRNFE
ncbi:MAG: hypothetical protein Q4P84_08145 [Elusimicrobiales bacterium]|nr:hypothetical protein [Elusimicrobiales bacterium]